MLFWSSITMCYNAMIAKLIHLRCQMLAMIHKIPSTESSFLGLRSWLCSKPRQRCCRNQWCSPCSRILWPPPLPAPYEYPVRTLGAFVWKRTFIAAIGFGTAIEASIDLEINIEHETCVGVKHHLTIVIATFSSSILWWPTISVAHHLVAYLDSSFGTFRRVKFKSHSSHRPMSNPSIYGWSRSKQPPWPIYVLLLGSKYYTMCNKSHNSSNKLW